MRTFRVRCAGSVGATPTILDRRQTRITDDWVTYLFRVEHTPTTGNFTFTFFMDNDEETTGSVTPATQGTVDVCLPWVSQGLVPRIPRIKGRLSLMRLAPVVPQIGDHFLADGVNWDPKARGLNKAYEVMWDGSGWEPVTAPEPVAAAGSNIYEIKQTGGDQSLTSNDVSNFQDIAGASATLPTGTYRIVDGSIEYEASATADISIRLFATAGLVHTGNWNVIGLRAAAVAVSDQVNFGMIAPGGSKSLGGIGAAGAVTASQGLFQGTIVVTTTGTLKAQARQSGAEASTVLVRNTYLKLEKIA